MSETLSTGLNFTEHPSRAIWHACLQFDPSKSDDVKTTLTELGGSFRYSGCFVNLDNRTIFQYTNNRGRPDKPIQLFKECEDGYTRLIWALTEKGVSFSASSSTGATSDPISPNGKFKALIGLREGYDEFTKVHDISEIRRLLNDRYTVVGGEIFSAGGNEPPYQEAVALIYCGEQEDLAGIYQAAAFVKQKILVIEALNEGTAYSVEFN